MYKTSVHTLVNGII